MAEQTSFDAATFTALGTARERVALPETTFDGTVNMPAMHLAVKAFLANQRQATAYTKTRGLVIGGNQKPWKQKGTGRARVGSSRTPLWRHGGTVLKTSLSDADESAQRDRVARHHRAHLRVVVAVVGHRNSDPRPALLAGKPTRDSGVGVVTEVEVNGRGRSPVGFVDELPQQMCRLDPRCGAPA